MHVPKIEIRHASLVRKILILGLIVLGVVLYCYGALEHSRSINLDITRVDQGAYLSYTRNMYETNYHYMGGRNRMPVYPFLQSLIYDPRLTELESFTRGKQFNILLSLAILPCLWVIFRKNFSRLLSVNLLLITAFTVFVFKAAYFQAELLFYFLNFCCFLLLCWLLQKPSWRLGILTGVTLGITHLTKASILPGMALFTLFFLAKLLYAVWQRSRPQLQNFSQKNLAVPLLSLALVILCFLATVYPYISNSQRVFGHYFYNVNSTFYIWYDSWEEAEQGTRQHGDNKGWPEMPAEEIPSLSRYLREHTAAQMLDRLWDGFDSIISEAKSSYGYFKYLLIYLAIALILSLINFRNTLKLLQQHFFLALFGVSYFVAYIFLYAWYAPIADGERFTLAQFIPFMFSSTQVIRLQAKCLSPMQILGRQIQWIDLFGYVILGMIVFELYPILTHRLVTMFAGT